MRSLSTSPAGIRSIAWKRQLLLCLSGLFINLAGFGLTRLLRLPLFLDTTGTVLTSVLGGYLPGMIIGIVTSLVKGFWDRNAIYYTGIHVLVGVGSAFFASRPSFRKMSRLIPFVLLLSLGSGALDSALTWFLYDFGAEQSSADLSRLFHDSGMTESTAQLSAVFLVNTVDKALTVVLALFLSQLVPEGVRNELQLKNWQQKPMTPETEREAQHSPCRGISLTRKIVVLVTLACVSVAAASSAVAVVLYHRSTVEEHTKLGQGTAMLAAALIDPERVEQYLTQGEEAEGYRETKAMLYQVRASSQDILYVYVYQIREDGCHVVFDLDTEETPGSPVGSVEEFDESFFPYLPDLLAGRPIEPIISDDSYGWLLTAYHPVYNGAGECVCYAAADISMDQLKTTEYLFLIKMIGMFIGFFALILTTFLWLARYHVILPLNAMAIASSTFAYDSEESRNLSVDRLRELEIRTGDEIENLYHALLKTSEDSVKYVKDIHDKSDTITRMQSGLILVLADMVESRDQCTGDHVRKTAAYVRIIMEEMRREGIHAQELTDEYINNVVNSAPLHDVGKIKVSDTVLNKPGKLTDEEFAQMKQHAEAGIEIISQAIALVPDSTYLDEAKLLAKYHHERWDGTGYPTGIAGEEIPLSARIMAVADVFDALVSRRSYKPGMPFEKAVDIIREGSGSHFDPEVVQAFLNAIPRVRQVAEHFSAQ